MPINAKDLEQWEAESMTMYAAQIDYRKELTVRLWVKHNGEYIVMHGKEQKYLGESREEAVDQFNELI